MSQTDVLNRNRFMALATVTSDGKPYCVPITYAFYDNALYWRSSAATVHSKNIQQNDHVSLAIFDAQPQADGIHAVYIQSRARRVDAVEANEILVAIGDKFSIKDADVPLYCAPLGVLDKEKSTDSRFYIVLGDGAAGTLHNEGRF